MPQPQKLVDIYSIDEIKRMTNIAGSVLYGILGDALPDNEKFALLRQINTYDIVQTKPEYIYPVYKNVMPGFAERFNDVDEFDTIVKLNETRKNIPSDNYYGNNDSSATSYLDDTFEEVIKYSIEPFKKISQHLDNYLKTAILSDSEIEYVKTYKTVVDCIANGKSINQVIYKNPAFMVSERFTGAMLKTETYGVVLELTDPENNVVDFVLKNNSDKSVNWKKTVLSIDKTPIMDMIRQGNKIQDDLAAFEIGNLSREQLKKSYRDYIKTCEKMFTMSQEEFDKIQARGGLQNNYDNFVSGSRSHNYAQYDAEARLQLLEAGYPMSDIPVMAQFYVNMKQLSRKNNLPGGDKSEKIDAECQAMEEVWNSVVKAPTKADTLNLESRKQGIDRLANYTRDLIGRIGNGEFKNTDLNEGRSMATILKGIETRKAAEPSLNEKIVLAGTAKDMFNAFRTVDPTHIISSSEFKAMKKAVENLAWVNKKENPAKYDLLRDEAIKATKAYLTMKNKEMKDGKHKRSDREAKRVNFANAIYDRLTLTKTRDYYREAAKDKRFVVNDDLSFKNAKAFIRAERQLNYGRKQFISELEGIANVLINTQDDRNKNFENTEELEGSTSYQLMTQSLQLAINKLKNPNSKPDDVKRALGQYNKYARKYAKDHEGILFGPGTGKGQSRLEMAKYGAGLVPGMINCYDNMRREFNPVKDETGKSYMDMTAQEIEDMSFHLEELHEQEMLSSSTIRTADNFERTFESSKKQLEVRKLISEKNKFMSSNYFTDAKSDRYVAQKSGASVSELAGNFIAKKYLDKVYKVGIKPEELEQIEEEIKNGTYDREVDRLQKNPVFKAVVKGYPEKAYSKWEAVERKAAKIQSDCQKELDDNLKFRVENCTTQGEFIINYHRNDICENAASVMVNQSIASKSGQIIAQAIAADSSIDANDVIKGLIEKETQNLKNKENYRDKNNRDQFGIHEYDGDIKSAETMQKYISNAANRKDVFNRIVNSTQTSLKNNEVNRVAAVRAQRQLDAANKRPSAMGR